MVPVRRGSASDNAAVPAIKGSPTPQTRTQKRAGGERAATSQLWSLSTNAQCAGDGSRPASRSNRARSAYRESSVVSSGRPPIDSDIAEERAGALSPRLMARWLPQRLGREAAGQPVLTVGRGGSDESGILCLVTSESSAVRVDPLRAADGRQVSHGGRPSEDRATTAAAHPVEGDAVRASCEHRAIP